jgi:CheY-like chemotaxis protein
VIARPSILIADDEIGIRDLFRFTLEPLGFEIDAAEDGMKALELIGARPFDLVVLDVHMPRMGGREALARLRELRPGQKVIVMSGRSDLAQGLEAWAAEAGALACVFKPLELDELLEIIGRALAETDDPERAGRLGGPR